MIKLKTYHIVFNKTNNELGGTKYFLLMIKLIPITITFKLCTTLYAAFD